MYLDEDEEDEENEEEKEDLIQCEDENRLTVESVKVLSQRMPKELQKEMIQVLCFDSTQVDV